MKKADRRCGWALLPFVALGSAAGPSALAAQAVPDLSAIVHTLDDLYRAQSSHAVMTMTVTRRRGVRELTLESWSRGEDEALIVIREPAREAGTATLRTEEGLWNYAPRADRLIRIPSGLLSESWMGSHFTNDDLLRESSYLDDHTAAARWMDHEGHRLLEVTFTPKPDLPVVYTRLVFLLDPDGWFPVQADYYDGEEHTRQMRFDQVRTVAERRIPMHLILQPMDEPDERTEIRYDQLDLNVSVDAEMFTRRGLRRIAGG